MQREAERSHLARDAGGSVARGAVAAAAALVASTALSGVSGAARGDAEFAAPGPCAAVSRAIVLAHGRESVLAQSVV
eukprot:1003903-Prymnesium_polylepis.1